MKVFRLSLIILSGILFHACHPVIMSSFNSHGEKRIPMNEVIVIGLHEPAEYAMSKIGDIEFKSSEINVGCSYEDAISRFKKLAAKNGGNVIKITEIKEINSLMEACISVKADIYFIKDTQFIQAKESIKKKEEQYTGNEVAYIYFYRPAVAIGDVMKFDIYLDDEFLCTSKSSWGEKVKVKQMGKHVLWTKSEKRFSMPILIEPGESYYVSCSVLVGLRNTKPYLKLEDKSVGSSAYSRVVGQVLTLLNR